MTLQADLRASLGAIFTGTKEATPSKHETGLQQPKSVDMSIVRNAKTRRIEGAVTAAFSYVVLYNEQGEVVRIHATPHGEEAAKCH